MQSFDPVTRQGLAITNLFWLELALSGLLLAIVIGWLIVAVVRFRARAGDATEPAPGHGHRPLRLGWAIPPALPLVVVFGLMIQTMSTVDASEPGAQPLRVIGHQ